MKRWSGVAVTIGQSGCPDRTGDYTSLGGVVAEAHARATPVYPSASGRDNGGRAADQRVTNSQSSKEEQVWQRREKRSPRLAGDEWSEHLPDGVTAAKG